MLTVRLARMLSDGTDEMLSDGMANFSHFPNVSNVPNFPGSEGGLAYVAERLLKASLRRLCGSREGGNALVLTGHRSS